MNMRWSWLVGERGGRVFDSHSWYEICSIFIYLMCQRACVEHALAFRHSIRKIMLQEFGGKVRGDEIFILYFHFYALVSRQSTVFSFATQHAMPCGERSILILGSRCLPCCVRDTA